MPLSKAEQAKWMREYRRRVRQGSVIPKSMGVIPKSMGVIPKSMGVIPKSMGVIPKSMGVLEGVQPDSEGYYPAWAITSWRQFNGRVRQMQLPNCPDGRYRCLNGV